MVCRTAPIGSPTHRGRGEEDEVADYETALDTAGYGRFSYSALSACALAFFTTGVQNCLMSYVLPAAKCELQLSTYQSGLVNMAFMCGGVASAFFWGIIGDVFGRRKTLMVTLIGDSLLTVAQSMVTDFRLLLVARVINGFLIGGPSTLTFTYLSDLVGQKRRQAYLTVVGMSFVGAWLILPAFAWFIIPIKIGYTSILPIYSWRLLLAVSSIPGMVAGLWTMSLPESPRLLSDTNRSDEALKILARIHKANRMKKEFKITKLIQDSIFVSKTLDEDTSRTKALFIGVVKDLKIFISKSYAVKSSLILFAFFANMAAGFGLNLWIPALLLRMQGQECKQALPQNAKLFSASNTTWNDLGNHSVVAEVVECSGEIGDDIFTSGLIVGACCVLGNAACALLCRGGARGVRYSAAACAFACALACAVLAACACACANSSRLAVAAAAALTAASLNGNVLLIRLLLHALPPKLSGLGVCWGAWWGRAGGVASNLAVGVLLDFSCPAPFISVAVLLAISIVAIMMIKMEEQKEDETTEPESAEKNTGLDRYISTHM
ncbi:synaptic vesicle glycoprotein 2B-like isoform X1 [Choristoneura fumiferana]|uniref:synaptic vesicle glycoprotein 2B-like isoform X1 n=1 Tax=Choristoneura fumiferana TaxID=7141 RepID=UPI003D15E150